ncbi:transcription termination/antitermination protein NusG [Aquisphaera insulae]|uniref:transcription termination/antitermination protein NusG n=1 Tax=Aquisphaera insulae TaxID=2712864 RepID=UPI0013EC1841|nr:transcription termination/antitermination protein NusG [Aquisphaera insulae]
MSDESTDKPIDSPDEAASHAPQVDHDGGDADAVAGAPAVEETPDGGLPQGKTPRAHRKAARPDPEPAPEEAEEESLPAANGAADADDEPAPELVWYVLKVQSSREDTIRDALQRRVKIQGLERFFGKTEEGKPRIVVPTEKITEIRNSKKRVIEKKTYPGYIMVQMELNEKTWFLVRETPGVGDFVGAHGTPTKMTDTEVSQMLHQEEEKSTTESPKVRIDVERGDRVKIKDGPFENFEGTVEDIIEDRGLVKVMLIIFNRPTPVDIDHWKLERI